jgi:beta-glucuronidase
MVHDLSLLKELGANVVRGSHYQQDQRFLDLCDEAGLIVWEESLGWQARTQHFTNPRFAELQEEQLRRMIRASANHPSVVFWGILNEGESFLPESRPVYERLAAAAREEDSSRMITYACNHPFQCINLDLCDVIAINQYPGWYPQDMDDPHPVSEIAPHLAKVLDHLDGKGFENVPKLMSEIGAGAIYGCRDQFRGHWSEEYQSDYLEELCQTIDLEPRWMGLCIWQFCDCRTKTGGLALGRPRSFNNKGLVDEYRRPKAGFQVVKQAFSR